MTLSWLGWAALALPIAAQAQAQAQQLADAPLMVEEAAAAGIDHVYDGPWEHFVGGGAAAFDCNGDRKPDLALAGGTNPARLFVNRSAPGGALRFSQKPLLAAGEITGVTGAYPIDIDNDGVRDLVLLRVGADLILRGGPDCTFARANRAWGFGALPDWRRAWSTAFAAMWEPGATFPTLAFGRYVDRTAPGSPWGTCDDNLLARPQPAPQRDPKPDYSAPLALRPGHCALSMLFTDWDNSGRSALRIANDRQYHLNGQEQLWRIEPGRPPRAYRAAEGWRRLAIWGMGIAEADLDADGRPEYALTSMGDTKLQTLDPEANGDEDQPAYVDIAGRLGATAHRPYAGEDRRPSTGWHAEFADFNNDGLLDLFIAKGNVESMPDFAAYDPDNLLLGQWAGGFAEAGTEAGIALARRGRGAAVADFNLDGALDLLVINRAGPASLFRNLGAATGDGGAGDGGAGDGGARPPGNWLEIELRQKGPNRDAIGARLSIRAGGRSMERRVSVGGGHASGRVGWVHVGLGVADRAEIRVRWPDGEWSHAYRAFANNFLVIERGRPEARFWMPR